MLPAGRGRNKRKKCRRGESWFRPWGPKNKAGGSGGPRPVPARPSLHSRRDALSDHAPAALEIIAEMTKTVNLGRSRTAGKLFDSGAGVPGNKKNTLELVAPGCLGGARGLAVLNLAPATPLCQAAFAEIFRTLLWLRPCGGEGAGAFQNFWVEFFGGRAGVLRPPNNGIFQPGGVLSPDLNFEMPRHMAASIWRRPHMGRPIRAQRQTHMAPSLYGPAHIVASPTPYGAVPICSACRKLRPEMIKARDEFVKAPLPVP